MALSFGRCSHLSNGSVRVIHEFGWRSRSYLVPTPVRPRTKKPALQPITSMVVVVGSGSLRRAVNPCKVSLTCSTWKSCWSRRMRRRSWYYLLWDTVRQLRYEFLRQCFSRKFFGLQKKLFALYMRKVKHIFAFKLKFAKMLAWKGFIKYEQCHSESPICVYHKTFAENIKKTGWLVIVLSYNLPFIKKIH